MPLDPEVVAFLESQKGAKPRSEMTIEETRQGMLNSRGLALPPQPLSVVTDQLIANVPVRIYQAEASNDCPIVVYAHGGRFISGNPDTHDSFCRQIAKRSGARIVAVDYRLAPEHRFPAALDDYFAVVEDLARTGSKVAAAGDSAGGNLAAAACLKARDEGQDWIQWQLLLYPMLDAMASLPSHTEYKEGFGPGSTDMVRGWLEYAPEPIDRKEPLLSPLWAEDLRGLPPAYIVTAEMDTLRDECDEYGRRLFFAGVQAEIDCAKGMIHGFLQNSAIFNQARLYLDRIAHQIRLNLFD